LLAGGAYVDAQTDSGCTALQFAATSGWDPMVGQLISRLADRSITAHQGEGALIMAARPGPRQSRCGQK